MRTYSNVLNDLITVLDDAVNLSDDHETTKEKLKHINVNELVQLSDTARQYGNVSLDKKLTELTLFADESGDRRRAIINTKKSEYQKGTFNTTHKDVLSSFRVLSECSFLFVQSNTKFIHCYFIIDNETNTVTKASFNETIYNIADPVMIGSINLLNDLERGLKTINDYK